MEQAGQWAVAGPGSRRSSGIMTSRFERVSAKTRRPDCGLLWLKRAGTGAIDSNTAWYLATGVVWMRMPSVKRVGGRRQAGWRLLQEWWASLCGCAVGDGGRTDSGLM